jgi:hypothetical protein
VAVVEICLPRAEFPETLNGIRVLLDEYGSVARRYRSAADVERGAVILRFEFADDDVAASFRKRCDRELSLKPNTITWLRCSSCGSRGVDGVISGAPR